MKYHYKYRLLAETLYLALVDDAFYTTMEASVSGDPSATKEALMRYLDYSMVEGENYGELHMLKNHAQGVSIWSKTLPPEKEQDRQSKKKDFLLNQMGEKSFNIYDQITRFMSEKSANIVTDNFWYLSILGIHPDFQNQSLGPSLLKKTLDITDQKGVLTFLETFTPQNMSFYQRLGYQDVASYLEPTTKARYWIMVREPSIGVRPDNK